MIEAAAPSRIRLPSPALFILGNALIFFFLLLDLRTTEHGIIQQQVYWGRDFVNVWTSGKLVLAGRLDLLYDPALYYRFLTGLFGALGPHNYSYPPFVLPLMVPFALLPYWLALLLWLAGTGWLFVKAAAPWWQAATGWSAWLILLTPAATLNIWTGHYGFLIGALLLFGWRALEGGRPLLAGLCFGLMAIKPHLALFVPLILLLRGEWRAIGAAALTVIALVGLSVLLFGAQPWRDFLTITTALQGSMIEARGAFFTKMSTSTATALTALALPRAIVFAAQVATAILALALVGLTARKAPLRQTALLAATATFLVLPYAFAYDLTVTAIGAALVMNVKTSGRNWRLAEIGFLAPQLGLFLAMLGVPAMPLLLLGLAIVQYRVAMHSAPVAAAEQAQA